MYNMKIPLMEDTHREQSDRLITEKLTEIVFDLTKKYTEVLRKYRIAGFKCSCSKEEWAEVLNDKIVLEDAIIYFKATLRYMQRSVNRIDPAEGD